MPPKAIFEFDGHKFDPEKGTLTMGDMEELEHSGVDLVNFDTSSVQISKLRPIARICLSLANPEAGVNDDFVKRIPSEKLNGLSVFIQSFFERNFPKAKGGRKKS